MHRTFLRLGNTGESLPPIISVTQSIVREGKYIKLFLCGTDIQGWLKAEVGATEKNSLALQ